MSWGKEGAFKLRAVLAATLSPTWGIYSGYELAESVPRPGYEEQIDNEKYEYKPRDFEAARGNGIEQLLTDLNRIRHQHPALAQLRDITFHTTTNDSLIAYSKRVRAEESLDGREDIVLTVVNLDPYNTVEGEVLLNLPAVGLPGNADGSRPVVKAVDELNGGEYYWSGSNYVRLDPHEGRFAHVFNITRL